MKHTIRLLSCELWGFKNVAHGKLEMPASIRRDFSCERSEILGIYGQNGSGKTTVIDALAFAKRLMSGGALPSDAADYIAKERDAAACRLEFFIGNEGVGWIAGYEFELKKGARLAYVSHECLSYRTVNAGSLSPLKKLFDYDADRQGRFFSPKYRWDAVSDSADASIELGVVRRLAVRGGTSFLFSADAAPLFAAQNGKNIAGEEEFALFLSVLPPYAREELFVIHSDHSATIALGGMMPFALQYDGDDKTPDAAMLSLAEPTVQSLAVYRMVKRSVASLNCVLGVLIPGMQLETKEYGGQTTPEGFDGMRFEILSVRGDMHIPIKYESEGIKKLISILSILIAMYHHASVCVVVDEFDAGVYEYLLGEILGILEENGRGQLIFTSHNLRPLEMIKPENLIFTTTNPDNRYIRLRAGKKDGNLRDRYIRSINVGGQKEEIYDFSNSFDIARAFRLAGKATENDPG